MSVSDLSVTVLSPLSVVADAFLRHERERVAGELIKSKTLQNYANGLRWLGEVAELGWSGGLAELPLGELTPGRINRWLVRLARLPGRRKAGHGRAKLAYDSFRRLLSYCVLEDLLPQNPAREVRFAYRARQVDTANDRHLREIASFLMQARDLRLAPYEGRGYRFRNPRRVGALVSAVIGALLVVVTGCRAGEAANALSQDWDPTLRQLTLRRSKNRRRVLAIPELLAEMLDEQARLVGSGPLFPSPRSIGCRAPISELSVWRMVVRAGEHVGIELWPTKLRHAFARAALRRGRSPREIADALGNSEEVVRRTYIRGEETPTVREIVEFHGALILGEVSRG